MMVDSFHYGRIRGIKFFSNPPDFFMPLKQTNIKGIKYRPHQKKSLKTQFWRSVFQGFKKNVDFTILNGIII